VKQFTGRVIVSDYLLLQPSALQEMSHEDPTVCPVVVQVRRFRAVSGEVFQPAASAPFVIGRLMASVGRKEDLSAVIRRC
jgi:hypothetical protein